MKLRRTPPPVMYTARTPLGFICDLKPPVPLSGRTATYSVMRHLLSVADLGNTRSVIVSDQLCQNTNQIQPSIQVSRTVIHEC